MCIRDRHFRTFIDDLRLSIRAKNNRSVIDSIKGVAQDLVSGLLRLKCKISKKTTILASNKHLKKEIAQILVQQGVKAKTHNRGRDLGVLTTLGQRRMTSTIKDRGKLAKTRPTRIGALTRVNRRATRLYNTGAWPQASYGIEGGGLPPTTLAQMRADAHQAIGPGYRGGCPITAIALVLGIESDPL